MNILDLLRGAVLAIAKLEDVLLVTQSHTKKQTESCQHLVTICALDARLGNQGALCMHFLNLLRGAVFAIAQLEDVLLIVSHTKN